MIVLSQLTSLARQYKTNELTVFREYLQLVFLNALYGFSQSQQVVFKGGTAIHLVFGAPRFSEDLDFTVEMGMSDFETFIIRVFKSLETEGFLFKARESLAGKRYLLSNTVPHSNMIAYINLDFSFREKVFQLETSNIRTQLPVLFTTQVCHMSKDEIFAEKIRAILNRKKDRDLYDLWYLSTQAAKLDLNLVQAKLAYYQQKYTTERLLQRIEEFDQNQFVQDLRPFVTIGERDKLEDLFVYIKNYLRDNLPII